MTDIAEVIGWKFNHQAGMSTRDGVITAFPGGIPSQADQDLWTAEYDTLQTTRDWESSMQASDSTGIPRWFEDYVTENSIGLAPGRAKDNYDAKVALRATKPGA